MKRTVCVVTIGAIATGVGITAAASASGSQSHVTQLVVHETCV